jgi:UDP-N-acetylglucosamine transferase subunit ALG13
MALQKTILVAPLHWGLGHATRCIPVIRALLSHNFNVILASDGAALILLQKEFPTLESIVLPSYNITYPRNEKLFKWALLLKLPQIQKTIASEKKAINKLVSENRIDGIISDNRLGVRSKKVPSAFITHQLNVLSGSTTFFSSKMHQKSIGKFDECWVPDTQQSPNLSGNLGHLKHTNLNIQYVGPLSRMQKKNVPKRYDVLALLSGPEPQRTLLEEKLITEFKGKDLNVLLVQGILAEAQKSSQLENITRVNFMDSAQLETAINESDVIVSRSGYTTIMDLAAMEKKAFFIPTPGQYEQKYLAKRLKSLGLVPYCRQNDFTATRLSEIKSYKGLKDSGELPNFTGLFRLFERE